MRTTNLHYSVMLCGISLLVGTGNLGCAARAAHSEARMAPTLSAPKVLTSNHFQRDRAGSISEQDLRTVLQAPVFLEERGRIGVVRVRDGYHKDQSLPLASITGELRSQLDEAGLFEATTEISVDWPADSGISGLRELAARYRSEYLLLYRHRFVGDSRLNGWGWLYLTGLGLFVSPGQTLQTAGVLEATLLDVKTGTILFTVFERVSGESTATPWNNELKLVRMQGKLLQQAAGRLSQQVVGHLRRLVAARPSRDEELVPEHRLGGAVEPAAPPEQATQGDGAQSSS